MQCLRSCYNMNGVLDQSGRPLHDLRISVTDRCNMRCDYCMPAEIFDSKHQFMHRNELLTFEEINSVVKQLQKTTQMGSAVSEFEKLVAKQFSKKFGLMS